MMWIGRRNGVDSRLGGLGAVICLMLSPTSLSQAQVPEQRCDLQSRSPEVVVLRDGTRLRGLIASTTPVETVLLLPDGERKVIASDEIEELRSIQAHAAALDRGDESAASVVGEATRLHLRGSSDGDERVTFYAVAGTRELAPARTDSLSDLSRTAMRLRGRPPASGFWLLERLCTAPCELDLAVGSYSLAAARGTELPVLIDEPVQVDGETTLEVRVSSHAGARWAFGLSFGGGLLLGAGTVLGGFAAADDGAPNLPLVLTGVGLLVVALVSGVTLAAILDMNDGVDSRVRRGVP